MRVILLGLLATTAAVVAVRSNAEDPSAEEVTELRESFGSPYQASPADFQRAVTEYADSRRVDQLRRGPFGQGSSDAWHGGPREATREWSVPRGAEGWQDDWSRVRPRGSENLGVPDGFKPSPQSKPPTALLLEKAFELERIAHELEIAGHVKESDFVRRAAAAVRGNARRLNGTAKAPDDTRPRRRAEQRKRDRESRERPKKRKPDRPTIEGGPHEPE